jgi:hypothetical protein
VLGSLRKPLTGREDVRTVVAVGEAPAVALNRVEAAVRTLDYPVERGETRMTIGGPPLSDYLVVEAAELDVGTRVELWGHMRPEVTHGVLQALAMSRPWTWAPSWDGGGEG